MQPQPVETRKSNKRWTGEEERAVARRIRDCELLAFDAVEGIPVADAIIGGGKQDRKERTKAASMERLEAAVQAVCTAAKGNVKLKGSARAARAAWAEAEALRWELAMSGRRIALGEARKLASPFMAEADLVQEGYVGLLRAAKRFDADRAIRFSTYARWWVRATMTRAIDHTGRPIRLPGCAVEQARNMRKAIKGFERDGKAYDMRDLAGAVGVEVSRAEQLMISNQPLVSLDAPLTSGSGMEADDSSSHDILADAAAVVQDSDAMQAQEYIRMHEAFDVVLDERQRIVINMRYGLEDGEFHPLSDVGKRLQLSRERVRQIERDALDRLREHAEFVRNVVGLRKPQ